MKREKVKLEGVAGRVPQHRRWLLLEHSLLDVVKALVELALAFNDAFDRADPLTHAFILRLEHACRCRCVVSVSNVIGGLSEWCDW